MAVSAPRSDSQSMRGARGDAHANECPGAMMPALPPVASSPSPSLSSSRVTSWPALARKYAVVTPTTPPPSTRVLIACPSWLIDPSASHERPEAHHRIADRDLVHE